MHLIEVSPVGQPVQRFCDQHVPITHAGQVYSPLAFTVRLPDQRDGAIPTVTMEADDTMRVLSRAFRSASGPVPAVLRIVLGDTPNVLERELSAQIEAYEFGGGAFRGTMTQSTIMDRAFGKLTYTPGRFKGLF